MLTTPEEKLEHLLHEVTWAWYATCLPADRRETVRQQVPRPIANLLKSSRIAEIIFTRFFEGMAPVIEGMRWQAHRWVTITGRLETPKLKLSADERQLIRQEIQEAQEDFFQFQLRALQLPATISELQDQLQVQLPWMYALFTPAQQDVLAVIAVWHAASSAEQECE